MLGPAGYARYPLFYEVMQKCHSIPDIDYNTGKGGAWPPHSERFVDVLHGWNDPNVNRLTDDRDADPVGGFPNMKIVPVRIEKLV